MAPRKRKAEGGAKEPVPVKTETTTSMRVTRSASRLAGGMSSASELAKAESPVKKAKATKKTKKKKKEDEEVKAEVETRELEQTTEDETDASESKTKTVVIEHCKQCNSFKTRANMVKNGIEKAVPQVTVLLNPEKPRKGCFEIREEGGKMFISLLDMKRPFQPMKDLDMDQVISDIVDKLK